MQTIVKTKWESLLASHDEPKYLRNVVRYDHSQFIDSVLSQDPQVIGDFAESIYSGDLFILENAVTEDEIQQTMSNLTKFKHETPIGNHRLLDDCPNNHYISDGSQAPPGGYILKDHSYFFFRWNNDDSGLYQLLDSSFVACKILGGFDPDHYVNNLPQDLFVDRIQAHNYRPGGGGILTTHKDPTICSKVNMGLYLTQYGDQYREGGFYVLDSDGKRFPLDPEIASGDMVLWYPGVGHGIESVDPDLPLDWNGVDGRWYVSLWTVESAYVKERHPSLSVEG